MIYNTVVARRYWIRKAVLAFLFLVMGIVLMRYPVISHPLLKIALPPLPFVAAIVELWCWWRAGRGRLILAENGDLRTRAGLIKASQMKEIHVLEWRGRYLAKLDYEENCQSRRKTGFNSDGKSGGGGVVAAIKLDGWIYEGLDEMIKAIYKRLHPEDVAVEGEQVGQ